MGKHIAVKCEMGGKTSAPDAEKVLSPDGSVLLGWKCPSCGRTLKLKPHPGAAKWFVNTRHSDVWQWPHHHSFSSRWKTSNTELKDGHD